MGLVDDGDGAWWCLVESSCTDGVSSDDAVKDEDAMKMAWKKAVIRR